MSARCCTITPDGNIVVMRGWRVAELARQAGLKPTYSGAVGGWMLDAKRLPDLVAHLEYRNIRFELEREEVQPAAPEPSPVPAPAEVGLW